MTRQGKDEGFVTVTVAGLLLVLVAVAALIVTLGAVAVTRHRAAATADLSALAAAAHALEGQVAACQRAAAVAAGQGGRITHCSVDGLEAQVEVVVRPAGRLGSYGQARARSRAGPAS